MSMTTQYPKANPRMAPVRWLLAAALVGVLAAGCSNGKAKDKDAAADKETAVPVETQPVKRGEMVAVYSGTAPIEAHDEALVVAKVGGEVRQIYVEEGDFVQAGQVLARLDGDRLRLTLAQTDANLRKLERDYKRTLDLSEKGLVSKSTAENTKYDLDALRAALRQRQARARATPRSARRSAASSPRARSRSAIRSARTTRPSWSPTSTRCSPTCTCRRRNTARSPLARAPRSWSTPSAARRFPGTISRISPTVDPQTGTFRARVEIPDPTRKLKPGMFGRVNIVYERRQDALQLPRTAILDADGQQSVYVVADGKAQQRVIRTGLANGGWIEVLDGLQGNERVVTVGQAGLKTGTPVKVVGEPAAKPTAALASGQAKAK